VNVSLTIRNYLFGFYIVEFEQSGEDKAKYGDHLLENIAEQLKHKNGLSYRNLRQFRQFYLACPLITSVVKRFLETKSIGLDARMTLVGNTEIWQSPIAKSQKPDNQYSINPEILVSRLSYTHLIQLASIDDPLKRAFYEIQTTKGNWSVRELKRQINTLFYERTGMSTNMEKLIDHTQQNAQQLTAQDILQNPYMFEFLGLKNKDMV